MPRYKLYLVGGRVLEIVAASFKFESRPGVEQIVFGSDMGKPVAHFALDYVVGVVAVASLIGEEK